MLAILAQAALEKDIELALNAPEQPVMSGNSTMLSVLIQLNR